MTVREIGRRVALIQVAGSQPMFGVGLATHPDIPLQ